MLLTPIEATVDWRRARCMFTGAFTSAGISLALVHGHDGMSQSFRFTKTRSFKIGQGRKYLRLFFPFSLWEVFFHCAFTPSLCFATWILKDSDRFSNGKKSFRFRLESWLYQVDVGSSGKALYMHFFNPLMILCNEYPILAVQGSCQCARGIRHV